MKLVLILLAVVVVAYVVGRILISSGKAEDKDGNNIPDSVDKRVRRVKQEAGDVVKATKEVAKQVGDVAGAVGGKPRRGRKKATPKKTTGSSKPTRGRKKSTNPESSSQ